MYIAWLHVQPIRSLKSNCLLSVLINSPSFSIKQYLKTFDIIALIPMSLESSYDNLSDTILQFGKWYNVAVFKSRWELFT